jgi:hypothetical protein
MLCLPVAFIALSTITQCNPLLSPQAAIHLLDDSHSTYPYHSHRNTNHFTSCATYNFFHNINWTPDPNPMPVGSIWHISTGHTTHIPGLTTRAGRTITHNTTGHLTQCIIMASFQCHYHLMTTHDRMTYRRVIICYYKCSDLALLYAMNRTIYYLLNGVFIHGHDVNHLIR